MNEYLLSLYKNARLLGPAEFHRFALGSLARFFQFDSAIWTLMDENGLIVGASFFNSHPGLARAFYEIAVYTDEQRLFFEAMSVNQERTVLSSEVISHDEVVFTDYYKDFLRPFRLPNGTGYSSVYCRETNTRTAIHFNRESLAVPIEDSVRNILDTVTPHLVNASLFNTSLFCNFYADTGWHTGFAICRNDGVVINSDAQFRRIFDKEWPRSILSIPSFRIVDYIDSAEKHLFSGKYIDLFISHAGPVFLCKAIVRRTVDSSLLNSLTARELEVAKLCALGLSYKLVAKELGVSAKTVDNHTSKIRQKLKISSLRELVGFFV